MQSRRQFVTSLAALGIASDVSGCLPRRGSTGVLESIDALMRRFVRDAGVSAGQLAVLRGGVRILSKVYADAPPAGYRAVTPQSLFRIASCSKVFTRAAVYSLSTRGQLDMKQRVFPLLGITKPAVASDHPDPHIDEITVQQLVDHAGGWNSRIPFRARNGDQIDASHFDPAFQMRRIAQELGLAVPPTKAQVARFMYGKPLQYVPGTEDFESTAGKTYSNFGYVLLGMVVEAVTGQPYVDYIRDGLDGKGAWSGVSVSPMLSRKKNPLEVWYDEPALWPSALDPQSTAPVTLANGGTGYITDLIDSAAGLMTNAETLARFSSRHALRGFGGRAAGTEFDGSMAGAYSTILCQPNGIDCAFTLNTVEFRGGMPSMDIFVGLLTRLLDAL